MVKLIKKKHLEALRFVKPTNQPTVGTCFTLDPFEVIIYKGKPDEPRISMIIGMNRVEFPGAYTVHDLQQLLFFYYGEDKYTELFGDAFPAVIISETKQA